MKNDISQDNKNTFSKNLNYYMNKNGTTRRELAKITNAGYSTITDWVKGNTYPRIDKIELLADYFNISKSDLVEDFNPNSSEGLPSNVMPLQKVSKLPIVGAIAAGKPKFIEEDIEGYILIDNDVKADFCLKVSGDSMKDANILDGDLAMIKRDCVIENGEIYAVAVGDSATLKKLYKTDDSYILQPCNNAYEPIIVKECDNPYIVGKLTGIIRKF